MTENQKQVLLSSRLGDGCIVSRGKELNCHAQFSSIHKEYMEFKQELLGDLKSKITGSSNMKSSYPSTKTVYILRTVNDLMIKEIRNFTIQECLDNLTDLGIALWFYDDGSLHKRKHFYNLNTHAFTEEEHDNILIPYFISKGYPCKKVIERKKSGKVYYYCYFGAKISGKLINELLKKYPVKSFEYKTWSSETIPEGSRS